MESSGPGGDGGDPRVGVERHGLDARGIRRLVEPHDVRAVPLVDDDESPAIVERRHGRDARERQFRTAHDAARGIEGHEFAPRLAVDYRDQPRASRHHRLDAASEPIELAYLGLAARQR